MYLGVPQHWLIATPPDNARHFDWHLVLHSVHATSDIGPEKCSVVTVVTEVDGLDVVVVDGPDVVATVLVVVVVVECKLSHVAPIG
jgi:hypothetical protein